MKRSTPTLLAGLLAGALLGSGTAQAFSFDFGDDNDFYYPPPWAAPYGAPAYGAPPPYALPPRLPRYERDRMRSERQRLMESHQEALNELAAMLYGGKGFDRTQAVQLARRIEAGAGVGLLRFFHPGSIPAWGSRALPSIWSNQEEFKAKADELKQAAAALAEELARQPDPKEAVYLPRANAAFECKDEDKACKEVAVSPGVWEKFNQLSATCQGCHMGFRGFGWW